MVGLLAVDQPGTLPLSVRTEQQQLIFLPHQVGADLSLQSGSEMWTNTVL